MVIEGPANSTVPGAETGNMRRGNRFLIIDPWDNESVFTYYSEFEDHWSGQTYVEVIVLILIFLIGFISNLLVLVVIRRKKRRPSMNVTDVFIANLALSDLLFTVTIPFIIATRITVHWALGSVLCKMLSFLQFVSASASILTMMMISIDRYIVICKQSCSRPIGIKFTPVVSGVVVVVVWFVAVSFSSPVAVGLMERHIDYLDKTYVFCAILWPEGFSGGWFLVAMGAFLFVLPVTVISIMYLKILLFVRKTSQKFALQPIHQSTQVQLKLVKMFVTVLVLFVVMWLPFFIVSFLILYTELVTSTHFTTTVIMAHLSPCINPVLYGYFNEGYRQGFRKLFAKDKRMSMRFDQNSTVVNALVSVR